MQPLTLAALNLVHNLGLGLAYQKTTILTKIGGVCARGASEKNVGHKGVHASGTLNPAAHSADVKVAWLQNAKKVFGKT